ncbi:MAG: universal stress protein [Pirellula sp.]|nr:universal stress protein [Pirellula sp.]
MMDENGFQRILVAIDFSNHSEAAFLQAVWLARTQGASIVLVHTLPDLRQVAHRASALAKLDLLQGEGEIFQREVRQVTDAKMRQLIQKHRAEDLDIKVETLLGEPFVELIHAVQSEGYDLVLAGTRGMAGWQQFLVGSTAVRLIRKCPASVWVVKDEHIGPPKVVLTATDFSSVGWKAVKRGALIAKNAKAALHLLHVIDEGDIPKSLFDKKSRQDIIDSVEHRLYDGLESNGIDRDDVTLHLSTGTPWQEVARLSKHLSVDLIAMGTVGRNGIPGLLLGNTAEKVLSTCDCSILAVKPDNFVSPIEPASWPLHPSTKEKT